MSTLSRPKQLTEVKKTIKQEAKLKYDSREPSYQNKTQNTQLTVTLTTQQTC